MVAEFNFSDLSREIYLGKRTKGFLRWIIEFNYLDDWVKRLITSAKGNWLGKIIPPGLDDFTKTQICKIAVYLFQEKQFQFH